MVPDDIAHGDPFHVSLHAAQVEKALIALCFGGDLPLRQQCVELYGHQTGVLHLPLGAARVDPDPVDRYLPGGRVEVLILQLSQGAAVHGIGVVRPEGGHIEAVGPPAHLLVGCESHLHGPMGHTAGNDLLQRRQNFSHSRLIIRPQKGGAVCNDQMLSPVLRQRLELALPQDHAPLLIQDHIAALIQHDPGLDVLSGAVGGCVHVGDQAQHRRLFAAVGGQGAIYIAVFVHPDLTQPQLLHLLGQKTGQHQLSRRGGAGLIVLVRLGVKGHIL